MVEGEGIRTFATLAYFLPRTGGSTRRVTEYVEKSMKIKLIIKDENVRRIMQNAENTARRVEQWPAWKRNAPEKPNTEQPGAASTNPEDGST